MSFGFSASDIIALPQLVWMVYKACRDSATDFAQLAGEVQSMHAVLDELEIRQRERPLSEGNKVRLAAIQEGCRGVLRTVEAELLKCKSLGTAKMRLRDRMRWGLEDVGSLRIRLISHTNLLLLFMMTLDGYGRYFFSQGRVIPQIGSSSMLIDKVLSRNGILMNYPRVVKDLKALSCPQQGFWKPMIEARPPRWVSLKLV